MSLVDASGLLWIDGPSLDLNPFPHRYSALGSRPALPLKLSTTLSNLVTAIGESESIPKDSSRSNPASDVPHIANRDCRIGPILGWLFEDQIHESVRSVGHHSFGIRYNALKSRSGVTLNVSQTLKNVVIVMGRPASICCQWRAENPNPIMSSWV